MTTSPDVDRPGPAQPGAWVKSSASFSNGNCVEVTQLPDGHVGIRHSQHPEGPVLRYTPAEWHAFLQGARNGEFDRFASG